MYVVFSCEPRNKFILMFIQPPFNIVCHTDVHYSVIVICEYICVKLTHSNLCFGDVKNDAILPIVSPSPILIHFILSLFSPIVKSEPCLLIKNVLNYRRSI